MWKQLTDVDTIAVIYVELSDVPEARKREHLEEVTCNILIDT